MEIAIQVLIFLLIGPENGLHWTSRTAKVSNSQIYTKDVTEGLYILTGNDVNGYFQSAANCTSVFILGHVRGVFSR